MNPEEKIHHKNRRGKELLEKRQRHGAAGGGGGLEAELGKWGREYDHSTSYELRKCHNKSHYLVN